MFQINEVKNWLAQFKQYFFTYSNGFYHLPYNGRSPESLVESFDKFPFVKHNKERQSIYANVPFCQGGFHYQKLEEGCWVVYSKMKYKTNVAYDLVYDASEGDQTVTADDYYMLSLNNINNEVAVDEAICKNHVIFPKNSWTFFKPKERNCDLNFKGANNKYITLYFNEDWLQKNLVNNSLFLEGGLDRFLQSDERFIMWSIPDKADSLKYFDVFDTAMNLDGKARQVDSLNLKFCTLNLIFDFFKLCKEQDIIANHVPIKYNDKFDLYKVENYLNNHLFDKFPGINFLANKFQISETKLKVEFRNHFEKPVYQYFQEKQMHLAKELLHQDHMLIKEISYKLGYENTSKFSAAFKKHHGVVPSAWVA